MRKQKPIHGLSDLPQDQKELLREWLDSTTPYKEIAQRVLDQFGVKTNKEALGRMRQRFQAEQQEQSAAENLETIGELMDQGALANIEYKPVTLKLVEKRLFEHALDPNTDTKVLKNLYSIIDQHERRQLESRRLDLREREIILKEPPLPRAKDPTEVHEARWDEWGMPEANRAFFRKEILDDMARQQAIRNLGHNPNPAHKIPPPVPGRADAPSASEGAPPEQSSKLEQSKMENLKSKIIEEPSTSPIDQLWLESGENKEKFLEALKSKDCAPTYIITHIGSPDWSNEKNEAIKEALQWQHVRLRQKSDERHARYVRERSSQSSTSGPSSGLPIPHHESLNGSSEPAPAKPAESVSHTARNRAPDPCPSESSAVQSSSWKTAFDAAAEKQIDEHDAFMNETPIRMDDPRPLWVQNPALMKDFDMKVALSDPANDRVSEPGGFNLTNRGLSPRNPRSTDESNSTPDGVQQSAPNKFAESVDQLATTKKSKIDDSVREYLTRRAHEWQRNGKNIRPTIYRECPCGNRTPCPDHGTFPEAFWHFSPWSADLADILVRKGLPWFAISLDSKEVT